MSRKACAFARSLVAFRDLSLQLRDVLAIFPALLPARSRPAQRSSVKHAKQSHSQSPAYPEFTGIFIGPGREIDIQTHIYDS
jgi:hypothetical protein